MERHLNLLGMPAKDLITGFQGVMGSVSYDAQASCRVSLEVLQ